MGVGGEVDDKEVEDKLGDLEGGQVPLPPQLGTAGSSVVVVVCDVEGDT